MNTLKSLALVGLVSLTLSACDFPGSGKKSQSSEVSRAVERQQGQYNSSQPIPAYSYSFERNILIQLYDARNTQVATHSVWRSNSGTVEGDCPSLGYGLPYDTSLTNPLVATDTSQAGNLHFKGSYSVSSLTSVEQPEPNGIYASKNTSATWVLCTGEGGVFSPVSVEAKVTAYPYPVKVDYATNRVTKAGSATVTVKPKGK